MRAQRDRTDVRETWARLRWLEEGGVGRKKGERGKGEGNSRRWGSRARSHLLFYEGPSRFCLVPGLGQGACEQMKGKNVSMPCPRDASQYSTEKKRSETPSPPFVFVVLFFGTMPPIVETVCVGGSQGPPTTVEADVERRTRDPGFGDRADVRRNTQVGTSGAYHGGP